MHTKIIQQRWPVMFALVLLAFVVRRCAPSPEPALGPGARAETGVAAEDPSSPPGEDRPVEVSNPPDPVPPPQIRGELQRYSGNPARGVDVYATGPALCRWRLSAEERGEKHDRPAIASLGLEDGILPPAWRVGRTDAKGAWVVPASWLEGGPVDLLFGWKEADGQLRVVHRQVVSEAWDVGVIRASRVGSIEGHVRTVSGQAAPGALVFCVPLDLLAPDGRWKLSRRLTPFTGLFEVDYVRHTKADEEGRFRLRGLRPGDHRVFGRLGDSGGALARVQVRPGPPNTRHEVRLDIAGAFIEGCVQDSQSAVPVAGCLVIGDDPLGSTRSGGDGTYRLGPLAPGEFRVLVLRPGYQASYFGPFPLVAGRTFAAPPILLKRSD